MTRVLIAQIGARRHYAVPRALYRAGLLETLVTDACADIAPWRWLGMMVPESRRGSGMRRLMGRSVPEVPGEHIKGLPLFSAGSYPGPRRGERRTDYWARRNAAFGRAVVRKGFGDADTVYAFNGAALEVFQAAKRLGLRTILDQTAAPWRWNARLLREEMARWPGWEDRPVELDESGALSEREETEWELADAIVCGSEFCRLTLTSSGVAATKCHVLPSPCPIATDGLRLTHSSEQSGKLHVLYAGTLQLRKGIPYLYEAARESVDEPIEIRLVGPSHLSAEAERKLGKYACQIGSVPRAMMRAHYEWADVLVLPTLSEGSANVCHEAMTSGIPVVTTAAAGSMVRDRISGLIVPERDSSALTDRILWMARDISARQNMGNEARLAMAGLADANDYQGELSSLLADIHIESYESEASISGD